MRISVDEIKFRVDQAKIFWRRFRRHRPAVISLGVIIFLVIVSFAPFLFTPKNPRALSGPEGLLSPSIDHPFGTDQMGRDIFSRVVYGTRNSLIIGFTAAIVTIIIGFLVGTISGYYGGIIDDLLMRLTDALLVLPWFFLMLIVAMFFGQSLMNIILVIGIASWPQAARTIRSDVLSIKERGYVEAARSMGATDFRILAWHITPNIVSSIIVNTTYMISSAVLVESYLSFLGVGDPNMITWGQMLMVALTFIRKAWWMVIFPGIAIFVLVLVFNLIGDGLNDALNPRLKGG